MTEQQHADALARLATAVAKTDGPASMAYACARVVWTEWWRLRGIGAGK